MAVQVAALLLKPMTSTPLRTFSQAAWQAESSKNGKPYPREMNNDLTCTGIVASDRHMMFGRAHKQSCNRVAPIIVSGNGHLRPRMLSILGCNSSGQGLALMRNGWQYAAIMRL